MFSGWVRYLKLSLRAKTGLSSGVAIAGLIAFVTISVASLFGLFALFIWLADRFTPLKAALFLAGGFLLIAVIAALAALTIYKRTIARAELALRARASAPSWFDPKLLPIAMRVGGTIGLKRILPLAGIGILAAVLAKEWFGGSRNDDGSEES